MHPSAVLDSLAVAWASWLTSALWSGLVYGLGIGAAVLILLVVVEWASAPRD